MDQDSFENDSYEELEELLLPTQPRPKPKFILPAEVLLSTFDHELKRDVQKN
uniref:Uncharacterized protein n=1 Tax=viral metagenome TaxID=1070528 RepID=A0A6C0C7U7_9ZZZZ